MRLSTSIILLSLLVLLSCQSAPETGLSKSEEQLFVDTYVNLVLATWDQQVAEDSLETLRQGVFAKMGITEERFMELSQQAESDPEGWTAVWDQIVKRLEAQSADTLDT